ncbi:MAG: TetR family transcriptional regulator [Lachnospiraceae bacterium]|nr:TetR family transcriptional regulator [Lachnospiraceae bacterium]
MKRINQFERTDRDITNALLKVMESKSLEKISVQDILDEAMINRSTFYQHFPDKYAVLERLQEKYVSGMTEQIDEIIRNGELDLDKINEVLCAYLKQNRRQMRQILAVRSENLDLQGRMRALFSDYLKRSGSLLNELERDTLADMMVSFFVHFLKYEIEEKEFSTLILDTWIDMTSFFFRVDTVPDAKNRILTLIGELHKELQTK